MSRNAWVVLFLVMCFGCGGNEGFLPEPRPAEPEAEIPSPASVAPPVMAEPAGDLSTPELPAAPGPTPVAAGTGDTTAPLADPSSEGEPSARNSRQRVIEQLGQIAESFAAHYGENKLYPSPAIWSGGMSWRVVTLLPFSSESPRPLLNINLNEPWTEGTNMAALARVPDRYRSETLSEGKTNFVLLTGSDTAYPGERMPIRDSPDGWDNTILVVVVDDAFAVPWTAPQDYVFSPETAQAALFGKFKDACYALFGGGTGVRRIPATISDEHLMALITPDGGERVSALKVTLPPTPEPDEALIAYLRDNPIVRFAGAAAGPAVESEPQPKETAGADAADRARLGPAPDVLSDEDPVNPDGGGVAMRRDPSSPRMPVPEPVVQQFALRVLRETHEEAYKRAVEAEDKRKVAEKLLALADSLESDPAGRFVALQTGRTIAIEAGDLTLALSATDALVRGFEVDELKEMTEVLAGSVGQSLSEADNERLLIVAGPLFRSAMQRDQYDAAEQILAASLAAARRLRNTRLISELANVRQELAAAKQAWSEIEHDVEILLADPHDPSANHNVGSYYCFVKQRWEDGLPLLVRSGNPRLAEVAGLELSRPQSSDEQLALADAWWKLAETGDGYRLAMRSRAAYWYKQVLPGLPPGIERIKAETRLARVESGN